MQNADSRDLVGGVLLALVGLAIAVHATTSLPLGSLQRMGPGLFPAALGVALVLCGVATAFSAFSRTGTIPRPELGPAAAVMGGLAAFALTIDRIGLLVAVPLLVGISSLASRKRRHLAILVLSAALCLASWAIFSAGFNMPIRLLRWNP
jgi:Tripartite tricarboxylate transporter TctB family